MRKSHKIDKQELINQGFAIKQVIAGSFGKSKRKSLSCIVRPQENKPNCLYEVTLTLGNILLVEELFEDFDMALNSYNELYECGD